MKRRNGMRSNRKRQSILILLFVVYFFIQGHPQKSFAVEPKPGDVINAANLEQYKSYFPDFVQRFIKDGAGMTEPIVIKVAAPKTTLPVATFMDASNRNVGKVTLNSDGTISGHEVGFPFPNAKQPNLAQKAIWNFYFRYRGDSQVLREPKAIARTRQRKGGPLQVQRTGFALLNYTNRVTIDPVPSLSNSNNIFWTSVLTSLSPPAKDMKTLTIRYLDPKKSDDMWSYIPTLRRTIRMITTERANPVSGSPMTWDDFFGFDGKINDFSYKLIGEEKILALMDMKKFVTDWPKGYSKPVYDDEPYQVRDSLLLEITPKNPRYPESKRLLWLVQDIWYSPYAMTYDKNGQLWKGLYNAIGEQKTMQGEPTYIMCANSAVDFKTSYWTLSMVDQIELNGTDVSPDFFSPGSFFTSF
jgi:hypothetical protein